MLTDTQCRKAKPRDKAYKLSDSKGLYLYVTSAGGKIWRWKYRIGTTEKRLVLGSYPDVSLERARELRDDARKMKSQGLDPAIERKVLRAQRQVEQATTFKSVAEAWHERQKPTWRPRHADAVIRQLKDDVFPSIGELPIRSVTAAHVLELLKKVEERGAVDRAHRLRQRISATFAFAIASGLAESDPALVVRGALKPVVTGHHPAVRTIEEARRMLDASEALPAYPLTRLAARLMALTTARSEAIRFATPSEFEGLDTDQPIWRIPAAHMKGKRAQRANPSFEFVVPLPLQAVDIVRAALSLSNGSPLLFPSNRHAHRPMSDNALSVMYRRLPEFAGRHVPHGWRSTFSTIMNERALQLDRPGDRAVIDLMLAHTPSGTEAIYNRAAYMTRRRELAQEWADLLLKGLPPASALLKGPRC